MKSRQDFDVPEKRLNVRLLRDRYLTRLPSGETANEFQGAADV